VKTDMRVMDLRESARRKRRTAGFTLAEVVVCIFTSCWSRHDHPRYTQLLPARVERYSLAAQALAVQQLESAKGGLGPLQSTNKDK